MQFLAGEFHVDFLAVDDADHVGGVELDFRVGAGFEFALQHGNRLVADDLGQVDRFALEVEFGEAALTVFVVLLVIVFVVLVFGVRLLRLGPLLCFSRLLRLGRLGGFGSLGSFRSVVIVVFLVFLVVGSAEHSCFREGDIQRLEVPDVGRLVADEQSERPHRGPTVPAVPAGTFGAAVARTASDESRSRARRGGQESSSVHIVSASVVSLRCRVCRIVDSYSTAT